MRKREKKLEIKYKQSAKLCLSAAKFFPRKLTALNNIKQLNYTKIELKLKLQNLKILKNQLLARLSWLPHPENQLCPGKLRLFDFRKIILF